MRQNLIYSFIVFLLLFVYMCAGFFTQLIMGAVKLELATFALGISLAISAITALISFFAIRAIRKHFSSKQDESDYRPSRRFVSIASVFVAISLFAGVSMPYFDISEQRQAAESAKNAAEAQKQKVAALAEAEKLRVAGLTTEQRDDEAKLKDEQAKTAAETAATAAKVAAIAAEVAAIEASRKEQVRVAEVREQSAIKAKENNRSAMAVLAVRAIKQNLRNPDSVKWGDVLANDDGSAVCIEYRAQNGYGGMNNEHVVFINGGLHRDGAAWNKHCANKKLYDKADFALRMVDR